MGTDRVVYVARDVTESVLAGQLLEERVEERTRELRLLLDLSQNVASTLDLRVLASRILDPLREVISYSGAVIMLIEGDEIVVLDARDASGAQDAGLIGERFSQPMPGPGGDAIERRAPVVVDDVQADAALAAGLADAPGFGSAGRSWLAAPLIAQDRVLGVLVLQSTEPGAYGAQHADLAMAVASQAAVAIENARLY